MHVSLSQSRPWATNCELDQCIDVANAASHLADGEGTVGWEALVAEIAVDVL